MDDFSANPTPRAARKGSTRRSTFDGAPQSTLERMLGQTVDAGLVGVPLLSPWFMGGRHPLGELVLVVLAEIVALAWTLRQGLARRAAPWNHSPAQWLLLAALGLVLLQIVSLPQGVLDLLSPHLGTLLPLWQGDATVAGTLGTWDQVSLTPEWTRAGLVLLLAYGMLFLVAVQRLQKLEDVEWLLRWIGMAVAVQAVFGIVQYLTSNGKFVWIYQHPFRESYGTVMGAYINRNHFAHLMALGLGPLVWWAALGLKPAGPARSSEKSRRTGAGLQAPLAIVSLGLVLFAGLMTLSRGGAAAMFVAVLVTAGALYRQGLLGKRFIAAMGGVFALIAVSLVIHGFSKVADRLDDYSSGSLAELDESGGRRAIWQADFKALPDFAPLGSGVGSHREIYPMYLSGPWEVEFTHAENGYLQVALETGLPGLGLILAGIVLCAVWCRRSLRVPDNRRLALCAAAVAGSLAASVVHSLADFVWYIPSLMAVTTLLVACACRLAQWSQPQAVAAAALGTGWPAWQRWGATALVALVGPWMVYNRFCATMAEPHWDAFLKYALVEPHDGEKALPDISVVEHLEAVLAWTPDNAKAHVRLASLLLGRFEQLQQQSANAMPLGQVCDAAFSSRSKFTSRQQLDDWLNLAIGEHRRLLDQALWHVRRSLAGCALLGEGYIHLADLCFLEGAGPAEKDAYLAQALEVRPHDGLVLLAAGNAAALRGDVEAMIGYWRPILQCRQQERQAMVRLLTAAPVSVEEVLRCFEPDLSTTRLMYQKYTQLAPPEYLQPLLVYYGRLLQTAIQGQTDVEAQAPLWFEMHKLFRGLKRPDDAIGCLRKSVAGQPANFEARLCLGQQLCERRQFAEAEDQLNWCAQRHPNDQQVKQSLAVAVKGRIDQQTGTALMPRDLR